MDATDQRFAYRCLPLTIANSFGWELILPADVTAEWHGGTGLSDLSVTVDGAAWDNGKIPLLTHELAMVNAMAKAAREQVDALVKAGTIEQYPFRKNETEKTLIWRDAKTGVLCRARLDVGETCLRIAGALLNARQGIALCRARGRGQCTLRLERRRCVGANVGQLQT